MKRAFLMALVVLALWFPQPLWAAELSVSDLQLAPCPEGDAGAQPEPSKTVVWFTGRGSHHWSRPRGGGEYESGTSDAARPVGMGTERGAEERNAMRGCQSGPISYRQRIPTVQGSPSAARAKLC